MRKGTLLLMVLTLFWLTACSNTAVNSSQPAPNSPSGNQQADGSKSDEKITLEFWHIDTGEKEKVYQEAIERFQAKHPNVEVKAVYTANDTYKQKLPVAMAGGNPPDVFHSWGGGWLQQFVDQGYVLDITGKIDPDNYNASALANATFNDKVYGVPLGLSVCIFWYNKDLFAKYNISPPKTWEELLNAIDTLKANQVIPIALANQPKWPGAYYLMYIADRLEGPDLFNSAYHRTGRGFDDPGYIKTGEYLQELSKRGAFNPGFNGLPYDAGAGRQLIYSEQAAMMLMNNSFITNIRSEMPDFEKKIDFFTFPAMPGGKGDPTNLHASTSPVWSVAEKSKHPDLAVEFIKELTSVETAQAFSDRTGSPVAVNGVEYKDEWAKRFGELASNANSIFTPYDQTLPPALAETHKDTTQALLGLTITPEEAAKMMEEKAKEVLK